MNISTPPPVPPSTPPPVPENHKFTLPIPGLILYFLGCGLAVGLAVKAGIPAESWSYLIGSLVGALIFPTLVAWIVWRVARRSKIAGSIAFYVVLVLVGVGQVAERAKTRTARVSPTVVQAAEDMRKELRDDFEANGSITPDPTRGDRMIQKMQSSAQNLNGTEKAMMEATVGFMKKLKTHEQVYQDAFEKLSVEGIMHPAEITNLAQIELHRTAVTNFMSANQELKRGFANSDKYFEAELVKAKLPRSAVDAAMRGYRSGSAQRNHLIAEIRDQDAVLGTNLLALLDLYQTQWGRWHYSEDEHTVAFKEKAPKEEYAKTIDSLVEVGEKQSAAQEKLVNLQAPAK